MESAVEFYRDLAWLDWQVELGADEAISEHPVNRYELVQSQPQPQAQDRAADAAGRMRPPAPVAAPKIDPVGEAQRLVQGVSNLAALRATLEQFEHCDLKHGARNLVFSDGLAGARVMIIGEAPGREEDREGRPFVGRAGQMLDRMLAAIDLDRRSEDPAQAVYITNVLPWRPPQNRDPNPSEIAMMRPFVERHVALAKPEVLVLMGNISCLANLGQKGITRLRGQWQEVYGLPVLPMFHPAFLLRTPEAKREAWADLLSLRAHLDKS